MTAPRRTSQPREITITPEDTVLAAVNERPEGVSAQRWADYNRKFNALLMGRDRELPPYTSALAPVPSLTSRVQAPRRSLPATRRRVEWAEVGVVLLITTGALAVDIAVAASLGAALGIMGLALVGRGLLLLDWL